MSSSGCDFDAGGCMSAAACMAPAAGCCDPRPAWKRGPWAHWKELFQSGNTCGTAGWQPEPYHHPYFHPVPTSPVFDLYADPERSPDVVEQEQPWAADEASTDVTQAAHRTTSGAPGKAAQRTARRRPALHDPLENHPLRVMARSQQWIRFE